MNSSTRNLPVNKFKRLKELIGIAFWRQMNYRSIISHKIWINFLLLLMIKEKVFKINKKKKNSFQIFSRNQLS